MNERAGLQGKRSWLDTPSCTKHTIGAFWQRDAEFGACFGGMQVAEGLYGTITGAKEERRGLLATSRLTRNSCSPRAQDCDLGMTAD